MPPQTTQPSHWTPEGVVAVIVCIASVFIPAIIALLKSIQALKESAKATAQAEATSAQMKGLQGQVTTLALATPPPVPAPLESIPPAPPTLASSTDEGPPSYKFTAGILALLTPVLALFMSGGCAGRTPVEQALDAHDIYNGTLETLITARQAGLITDAQKADIEKIRVEAYALLEELDRMALGETTGSFDSTLSQYRAAVNKLLAWRLRVVQAKATNQPSTRRTTP